MGERIEKRLGDAAKPGILASGHDYRVFWNAVPHQHDDEHPEDVDWARSEPDPEALRKLRTRFASSPCPDTGHDDRAVMEKRARLPRP